MKTSIILAVVVFVTAFGASPVVAVQPLLVSELAAHCADDKSANQSADQLKCVRYIQGFIDGAVATDERVVLNMETEMNRERETFTERAMRTRGSMESRRERAARYAEFCLGEPVPLREVAEHVVADLFSPVKSKGIVLARDLVYATLREKYPCQPAEIE